MLGGTFYFRTIQKLIVAFGDLFNDSYLVRFDAEKKESYRELIPLIYGPKQKYLVENIEDPNKDKQIAITYPIMSFELSSFERDMSRSLQHTQYNYLYTDDGGLKHQLVPTPYNIGIDMYVIGKNAADCFQIVERILPRFKPQYVLTINVIPSMNLVDNVPLILESCSMDDYSYPAVIERRSIIWRLSFTAKVQFYMDENSYGPIREVTADVHSPSGDLEDSVGNSSRIVRIVTVPDPIDAQIEDDYGFSTDISEFSDGLIYNPETGQDE